MNFYRFYSPLNFWSLMSKLLKQLEHLYLRLSNDQDFKQYKFAVIPNGFEFSDLNNNFICYVGNGKFNLTGYISGDFDDMEYQFDNIKQLKRQIYQINRFSTIAEQLATAALRLPNSSMEVFTEGEEIEIDMGNYSYTLNQGEDSWSLAIYKYQQLLDCYSLDLFPIRYDQGASIQALVEKMISQDDSLMFDLLEQENIASDHLIAQIVNQQTNLIVQDLAYRQYLSRIKK